MILECLHKIGIFFLSSIKICLETTHKLIVGIFIFNTFLNKI